MDKRGEKAGWQVAESIKEPILRKNNPAFPYFTWSKLVCMNLEQPREWKKKTSK